LFDRLIGDLDVCILGSGRTPAIGRAPDDPAAASSKSRGHVAQPPYRLDATDPRGVVFHMLMEAADATADTALAARLADDLDGSFEELVDAHAGRLFSIALRILGDRPDAEEAAQDALVRAYRALSSYDATRVRELRLRGWLATILVNVCRNRTRVKRVSTVELAFDPGAEPTADPMARRDEKASWARRLAQLPPAQRMAVVLRHVDGLSYAEMAAALGKPEGTLKAQVHRGLVALREAYLAEDRREREEMTA
jgi:RNA polymerase sigma factor (sigma-70 family)